MRNQRKPLRSHRPRRKLRLTLKNKTSNNKLKVSLQLKARNPMKRLLSKSRSRKFPKNNQLLKFRETWVKSKRTPLQMVSKDLCHCHNRRKVNKQNKATLKSTQESQKAPKKIRMRKLIENERMWKDILNKVSKLILQNNQEKFHCEKEHIYDEIKC